MHSIFFCDISGLRPWTCSPGILFCPQILKTCRSRNWGFLSRRLELTSWIPAGFSKGGVNGPGNICHFTSTWWERRDSFLFCVILPKIWILWTPGEQKLLFGGTIILGKCSAVVRDTDESDTASPGLRAPAKCAEKPGRDFPTPNLPSRPELPVEQGEPGGRGRFSPRAEPALRLSWNAKENFTDNKEISVSKENSF